jgi:tetratricopeptide (TPR) repeat protein
MRRHLLIGVAAAVIVVAIVVALVRFRTSGAPHLPPRPAPVAVKPRAPLWTNPSPPWANSPKKPETFDEQVRLGDSHYDRGEHAQAIEAYQKALTVGDSAYVRTNLGVSLHALRRTDEALEQFARALELDPAYWKASFNELVIYANRKDYARALARIERLRALQRTNGEIPPLDDLERHLRARAAQGGRASPAP